MAIAGIFKEFGLELKATTVSLLETPAMIITYVTEHFSTSAMHLMSSILLHPYNIDVFFVSSCCNSQGELRLTDYTWLKSRWWDSRLSQPLLLLCLTSLGLRFGCFVLFCLFICLFFYLWKLKAGLLVFKILSSKISSCFIHYLQFLFPLSFSASPYLPTFTREFRGMHHGMGGIFPPLSYEAACVSMQTCTVALWQSLLEPVYTLRLLERGIWLFSFTVLTWPAAATTLSDAGLMGWREAYGGSPPDSALWVCELYMVICEIWLKQSFSRLLHMSGPMTCKDLRRELERELSPLHSLIPQQMSSEEFHQSFHYSSIGIDVCKVLQLGNSLYVYIYFAVFFSVAVTQRPECFGIRRPGLSVASITSSSLVHLTHLLVMTLPD